MDTDPDVLNATLIQRRDLTSELSIVRIKPDFGPVPEFEPGQFIMLALPPDPQAAPPPTLARPRKGPRLIRRAYSIASSPLQRDWVELYVVLVREGRLTPKLWPLEEGDRLWLDDKAGGTFTLQNIPRGKDLVMVATGTGLAPYMSMLRTLRSRIAGQQLWRRFILVHGVRAAADLGYRDEIESIMRDDPTIAYIPTLSREPDDSSWPGPRGRVQQLFDDANRFHQLAGTPLDPEMCHVFLCGNPDMIMSTQALLESRGFRTHQAGSSQPGNIHFERYW